jgi:hypothetical protein
MAGLVGVLDSSIRFNQLQVGLLSPAHFRNLFMDWNVSSLGNVGVCSGITWEHESSSLFLFEEAFQ